MSTPQEYILYGYLLAGFILISVLAVPLYKIRSQGYRVTWASFCCLVPFLICMSMNTTSGIKYFPAIVIFASHALMLAGIRHFKKSGEIDEEQNKLAISFLCLFLAVVPLQASLYAGIFEMGLTAYVVFWLPVTIPSAAVLRIILMFIK